MTPLLKGTVVLVQKNSLHFNAHSAAQKFGGFIESVIDAPDDIDDSILDTVDSFLNNSVALRLISASKTNGINLFILIYTLTNKFFKMSYLIDYLMIKL